jgi:hypothetical protein
VVIEEEEWEKGDGYTKKKRKKRKKRKRSGWFSVQLVFDVPCPGLLCCVVTCPWFTPRSVDKVYLVRVYFYFCLFVLVSRFVANIHCLDKLKGERKREKVDG